MPQIRFPSHSNRTLQKVFHQKTFLFLSGKINACIVVDRSLSSNFQFSFISLLLVFPLVWFSGLDEWKTVTYQCNTLCFSLHFSPIAVWILGLGRNLHHISTRVLKSVVWWGAKICVSNVRFCANQYGSMGTNLQVPNNNTLQDPKVAFFNVRDNQLFPLPQISGWRCVKSKCLNVLLGKRRRLLLSSQCRWVNLRRQKDTFSSAKLFL